MYDLIIIGGGPGGLQLAVRLEELAHKGKKINYKIIESNSGFGTFFYHYPVHGKLISNNKLYTGKDPKSDFSERFDWNSIITEKRDILMRDFSTDFYPDSHLIPKLLDAVAANYGIQANFNEYCTEIKKMHDKFIINTEKETYESKYVVISTGYKLLKPSIKGIDYATPYCNMKVKSFYRDKSVLIIGKGNSGLECAKDIMNEANMILMASPESIKFAYQTHYVGSPRLVNCVPIENYQLKSMSAMLDCNIREIDKMDNGFKVTVEYTHADREVEEILVDEVIYATGFEVNLPNVSPSLELFKTGFPMINGEFESSNIENLYFAGAITHGIDYKQYSSSGFIHGFRYNSVQLAESIYEKITGINNKVMHPRNNFVDVIFAILNNNAGIYLQPGFMGIHLTVTNEKIINNGYCTIPAFEDRVETKDTDLLLTLEYGDIIMEKDPLAIVRDPGVPEKSVHLHPVIRVIENMDERRKVLLEENLFNTFNNSKVNCEIISQLEQSI